VLEHRGVVAVEGDRDVLEADRVTHRGPCSAGRAAG
jgi:hypothetical protein